MIRSLTKDDFSDTKCPPLESGDHLSQAEFERRYQASRHIKKAELIEGVVYVASPLSFQYHAQPHSQLHGWIWTYQLSIPALMLGIDPTLRLDLNNEPQPDLVLILNEKAGGQTRLSQEGYLEGTPELVIEIAASSASIDLTSKKEAYCRNRIPEYIVWQIFENELIWFQWIEGTYQPLPKAADGVIRSRIFPGLWLDQQALLQGDMPQVLAVLQQGIQSPEHQEFVKTLATRLENP
jgi:Uma2 family endonuclease